MSCLLVASTRWSTPSARLPQSEAAGNWLMAVVASGDLRGPAGTGRDAQLGPVLVGPGPRPRAQAQAPDCLHPKTCGLPLRSAQCSLGSSLGLAAPIAFASSGSGSADLRRGRHGGTPDDAPIHCCLRSDVTGKRACLPGLPAGRRADRCTTVPCCSRGLGSTSWRQSSGSTAPGTWGRSIECLVQTFQTMNFVEKKSLKCRGEKLLTILAQVKTKKKTFSNTVPCAIHLGGM